MTDRERFIATMEYKERDRAPFRDFGAWPETKERWKLEGYDPLEYHVETEKIVF